MKLQKLMTNIKPCRDKLYSYNLTITKLTFNIFFAYKYRVKVVFYVNSSKTRVYNFNVQLLS